MNPLSESDQMHDDPHKAGWHLFIDTGGTFTDCLGRAPDGVIHRCKVLSSSALRATVVRASEADRLIVAGLPLLPDGFFRGFRLAWPGSYRPGSRISASETVDGGICITAALPKRLSAGEICELVLDEEEPHADHRTPPRPWR